MNVKIHYKQKFMGEILEDSYDQQVVSGHNLVGAFDGLQTDPHVFKVWATDETGKEISPFDIDWRLGK